MKSSSTSSSADTEPSLLIIYTFPLAFIFSFLVGAM